MRPNCIQNMMVPSSFKNKKAYDKKMAQLEQKLVVETMKPFVNSGHAFVCFDSVSSCNIILRHFKITKGRSIKLFCIGIKNTFFRFIRCFGRSESPLLGRKGQGNFLKHSEEQELINIDYERSGTILIARKASEPIDILWSNMGEIVSQFNFLRFFLFLIALFCILFLSSPVVMLSKLKKNDPSNLLSF